MEKICVITGLIILFVVLILSGCQDNNVQNGNELYTLILSTSGTGTGTIQANISGPYYYGDTVKIWANATDGSTFTGFTASLNGNTTPQTLIIDGNKTVNAVFTLKKNNLDSRFIGEWQNEYSPDNETWTFYINSTLKDVIIQELDGETISTTSWFNWEVNSSSLCISSMELIGYYSECFDYEFSNDNNLLYLSFNGTPFMIFIKIL